jgi:hypothetical protein
LKTKCHRWWQLESVNQVRHWRIWHTLCIRTCCGGGSETAPMAATVVKTTSGVLCRATLPPCHLPSVQCHLKKMRLLRYCCPSFVPKCSPLVPKCSQMFPLFPWVRPSISKFGNIHTPGDEVWGWLCQPITGSRSASNDRRQQLALLFTLALLPSNRTLAPNSRSNWDFIGSDFVDSLRLLVLYIVVRCIIYYPRTECCNAKK